MKVDSLDDLKSAFAKWRRRKKHAREATPEALLARAQRAAKKHGVAAVVRVTGVDRSRLFRRMPAVRRAKQKATTKREVGTGRSVPSFSRLELGALSAASPRPLAEVETATGVRLRLFEGTPEMMGLLTAVCGFGGMR